MIWGTTRHVNHTLVGLLDGFVYRRVKAPGTITVRQELAQSLNKKTTDVPTISSYINDMMRQMVFALKEGPPTLEAAKWIRARVYELLGLMITGSELTSGLVWSTVRLASTGTITDAQATKVLDILSRVRWVPSYRTPLILEMIVAAVYQSLSVT
jgi:hypothetical protein